MTRTDVVVIGAGAIGLAVAWRAAQRGMTVTIIDSEPGSGASWAAAGMLAAATEAHYGEDRLLALNLESARRYPAFVEELERDSGQRTMYHRSGTLLVARDSDDNAVLEDTFVFQGQLGLAVTRLRGSECREIEPALSSSVRGGILVEDDHQIDNRALVSALIAACERRGVDFIRHKATAILSTDGHADGVAFEGGEIQTHTAVLAAGCWSGDIEGLLMELPVRPVKGQLLHLRSMDGKPPVRHNLRGLDIYIVPRPDGRMVVGATVEEQAFDVTVTAGAALELLRAAYELLPGVTEMELTEIASGLRPGSPDNAPMIGPARPDGLIVATGHFRNGVLLTPVTADSVIAMIETGDVPAEVAGFSPHRFDAGG